MGADPLFPLWSINQRVRSFESRANVDDLGDEPVVAVAADECQSHRFRRGTPFTPNGVFPRGTCYLADWTQ
jgi:hypothetical protein